LRSRPLPTSVKVAAAAGNRLFERITVNTAKLRYDQAPLDFQLRRSGFDTIVLPNSNSPLEIPNGLAAIDII
jgi:hypothetical protein